ncbi:MAG TPA: MbtH family NRPS accessory protein, partial [Burkholderiaceae bacterium]|nr:MbtH family NRPS accessory protein [Burkholderiaceae bacterium]
MDIDKTGEPAFDVVANEEQQYSIWPAGLALPAGWVAVGHSGAKSACLAFIADHWTDLRPLSQRATGTHST